MSRPLCKIRVLDFTRLIPGPFCTKILADLGAEVIKVEDMKKGDYINFFPPKSLAGDSVHAVYFHKNKKRLKLDFTIPEGRRIIEKLVRRVDVVIESYRPGVMTRWGLGFKDLKRLNKKLLYVSITGFGQKGPSASRAGHDMNFLAESGFLQHLMDRRQHPLPPAFQIADYVGGGAFAALQICAALAGKRVAQHLDVSMTAAMAYLGGAETFSASRPETSAVTGASARYQIYKTRDGKFFCLAALEDKFWEAFCQAVKHPEWADCGFAPERNKDIIAQAAAVVAEHSAEYWQNFAIKNDVCASLLASRDDLLASGLLKPLKVRCGKESADFTETEVLSRQSAQRYARAGHDNVSLLRSLGYQQTAICALKKAGVLP